jgi:hypothetical protein
MPKSADSVFSRTGSTAFAKYSRIDKTLSVEKLSCGVLAGLDCIDRLSLSFINPEPHPETNILDLCRSLIL